MVSASGQRNHVDVRDQRFCTQFSCHDPQQRRLQIFARCTVIHHGGGRIWGADRANEWRVKAIRALGWKSKRGNKVPQDHDPKTFRSPIARRTSGHDQTDNRSIAPDAVTVRSKPKRISKLSSLRCMSNPNTRAVGQSAFRQTSGQFLKAPSPGSS